MTARMLAASAAAATCAALGPWAPSAHADQPLYGLYDVSSTPPSIWSITSDCLPSCTARVHSSAGWQGFASLSAGTWTLSIYRGAWPRSSYAPDPAICPAARPEDVLSQTFTFEASSLAGNVTTVRGDQCGGPTVAEHAPITLVKRT